MKWIFDDAPPPLFQFPCTFLPLTNIFKKSIFKPIASVCHSCYIPRADGYRRFNAKTGAFSTGVVQLKAAGRSCPSYGQFLLIPFHGFPSTRRQSLLLLFIKPQTAGHHQLRGLKNIFNNFFFYGTQKIYRTIGKIRLKSQSLCI